MVISMLFFSGDSNDVQFLPFKKKKSKLHRQRTAGKSKYLSPPAA